MATPKPGALIICSFILLCVATEYEISCGTWQSSYTALHKRILSGEAPQRYLVSIPPSTGLADKLVGLPTQLLWAVLTDRALQHVPRHSMPPFESFLNVQHINISGPNLPPHIADSPNRIDFLHYAERKGSIGADAEYPFRFNFSEYFPICLRNNDSANTAILTQSDLRIYPPTYFNTRTLLIESNRGMTYRLFDNPFHRAELLALGLTPENAFSCAFKYLFSPIEDSCTGVCRHILQSIENAKQDQIAIIGIQVRVGDAAMEGNDTTSFARAAAYFKCAADIAEQIFQESGRKSKYYLISDSLSLLQQAYEAHGEHILVDTTTRPTHIARCSTCRTSDRRISLLQYTMNQIFLFSKCHYHIVTTDSGFGMLGAWMNGNPVKDRIFRLSSDSTPVCKRGKYYDVVTEVRTLASSWSGI